MDGKSLTPGALDHFASTYYLNAEIEDVDIEERAQLHSVPRIVQALSGCERVLEMGYGTGLITGALLREGVPLEVVEGSPVLSEHARQAHPGLVVHTAMFEEFDGQYDAVLALHVLEHVDDTTPLLRRIRSWLTPNGVLLVVTPNAESLHRQLAVQMGLHDRLDDLSPRDHLVGHRRVYDLKWLRSTLEEAGFDVVDEFGYFVKPLSNAQMLEWGDELLEGFNRLASVVPAWLCANIGLVGRRQAGAGDGG